MSGSTDDLNSRLEAACDMARDAGNLTLDFFRGETTSFERKADDTPVTEADRQAEQLMRKVIEKSFPRDAIVGEEFGQQSGNSGYRWILDPIDGTKSFISGVPLYGTLIGLEKEGRSIVGVIYIPALGELLYAATGCGAWYCNGGAPAQAARVSTCEALRDGLFVTSEIESFHQRDVVPVFRELQRRAYITRTWGDCYGYLLVATGRAEVMIDPAMSVWDAAALQPIMEEAGGTFTDWKGTPTIFHGEGIGTNRLVLDEVLSITRPAAEAAS